MAKFKLIALSRPVEGKEAEFHEWYQTKHLPEIVGLPGGVGAQRYQLVAKLMGADVNEFLAIYDIEGDDPRAFLGALGQASADGRMTRTDANDMGTVYTALFSELGERVGE
jgi:hypothetical protein